MPNCNIYNRMTVSTVICVTAFLVDFLISLLTRDTWCHILSNLVSILSFDLVYKIAFQHRGMLALDVVGMQWRWHPVGEGYGASGGFSVVTFDGESQTDALDLDWGWCGYPGYGEFHQLAFEWIVPVGWLVWAGWRMLLGSPQACPICWWWPGESYIWGWRRILQMPGGCRWRVGWSVGAWWCCLLVNYWWCWNQMIWRGCLQTRPVACHNITCHRVSDNTGLKGGLFQGTIGNILGCNPTLSRDSTPLTIAKAWILPTICAGRHKATCCDIVSGLGLVIVDKFSSFWKNPFGKPTHFNNLGDATVKHSLAIRFDQRKTSPCLPKNINCCDNAHRRMVGILTLPETMLHIAKTVFILFHRSHRMFSNVFQ